MENKQEISTTTSSATMFKDFSAKLRLSSFSYDNIATVGQYLGSGLQKWRDGSFLLDINLVGRLFGGGGGIGQRISPRRRLHSEEPLKTLWLNDKVIPTTHDEYFNHIENDIHTINSTDVLYYKNRHQNGHDHREKVSGKGPTENVTDSVNILSTHSNTSQGELPCFEECAGEDYSNFKNENLKLDTDCSETSTGNTESVDTDMINDGIADTLHDEESNKENESVLNKRKLLNQDDKHSFDGECELSYLLTKQCQDFYDTENDIETSNEKQDKPQQYFMSVDDYQDAVISLSAETNTVKISPVTEEVIFEHIENELSATNGKFETELENTTDSYEDDVFLSASDITGLFDGANRNLENDSSNNELYNFENVHISDKHRAMDQEVMAESTKGQSDPADQEVANSFAYLNVLDGLVTCRILTPCLEEEIRTKILSDDTDLEFLNIRDGRVSFKSRSSLDRDYTNVFDEEESFNINELFGESNKALCDTEGCDSDSVLVDISNLFNDEQVATNKESSVHEDTDLTETVIVFNI